jgi:acetolactate synthase-1/2/3 large subunit/sulfoacetaldehyde acetyltransferase
MARISGGAAVVEALRVEGVTHVFGVIGTAMLEVFDALYDATDVTYVGVRHEQNAVHMADGFGRVSGRPGVVLAGQPGPGATNLVTGLAEARLAFSPVVAIAGATASNHVDRDTFQEVDQQALFTPVTKRTTTVPAAERIPEYVQDAFRISRSGRRGPVVVNIPGDLLAVELDPAFRAPEEHTPSGPAPGRAALLRAAEILNGAERPLILAGAGVKWARATDRLLELAEKIDAPIAASAGNGDVVPNDHPLCAGQVGPRGNVVATDLARTADVILALGTRLGYNTTLFKHDNLSADAKIIQVDIEPSAVGRYFPVAVGIVADACETIDALLPVVSSDPARAAWVSDAQARRRELLERRAEAARDSGTPLHPLAVFAAVQRVMPRDAIVTVDTGTCSLAATDAVQTFQPPSLLTPLDFGLVGFSHAAGLGAKAAAPGRPVISLMGDGGFGMGMVEIGTAIAAGLHTVTIVLNNGCWGAEKAYQRDFFGGRYLGADNTNPAFDEVARAFGAAGMHPTSADEVSSALADALREDRPTVIEVDIDPDTMTSFRRDSFPHRTAAPATSGRR